MANSREVWTFENVVNFLDQVTFGGRVLLYGFIHQIIVDSITARPGGGQDTTFLTGSVFIVTTVATANDSVTLTTPVVSGLITEIRNEGVNNLAIFPAAGHSITNNAGTNLGANNPYTLAPNTWVKFISRSATAWNEVA